MGPADLSRIQIEREQRIRQVGRRRREVVAGPDIQDVPSDINRRGIPNGPAGGTVELGADAVSGGRARRFRHGVGLPETLSAGGIERDDAATKRAARVSWVAHLRFLTRGHRHVQAAVVELRRRGDRSMRMFIHIHLPEHCSNLGVYGVHVGSLVAEVGDELAVAALVERDGAADTGFDLGRPVDAARLRVQDVHDAFSRGGVHAAPGHDRLRACRGRTREPERPLQRESWQVVCRHPGCLSRLKPRVRDAVPPAVPGRPGQRIGPRSGRGAAQCRRRHRGTGNRTAGIGGQRFSGRICSQRAALRAAPLSCLCSHRATFECFEYLLRAHPPHHLEARRLRIRSGSFVTRGTVGPEQGRAFGFRGKGGC